jgi:hypothetical protein
VKVLSYIGAAYAAIVVAVIAVTSLAFIAGALWWLLR